MVHAWQFGLVGILAVAVATDLQSRKIYNWLTFPAMAVGLALSVAFGGWAALVSSLLGFLAGALVFFIGWSLSPDYMGAGDVKLMAAIGLWLGWPAVVTAVLYVTAIGGIVALGTAAYNGKLRKLFSNLYWATVGLAVGGSAKIDPKDSAGAKIPYGVSICLGGLLALFFPDPQLLFKAFHL